MATAYALPLIMELASSISLVPDNRVVPMSSQPKETFLVALNGSAETPHEIMLGTLFDARFRVVKPIPVSFQSDGESTSAVWAEIDEFGTANSASAASVELARSLAELYTVLLPEHNALGPDLQRIWSTLNDHIRFLPKS